MRSAIQIKESIKKCRGIQLIVHFISRDRKRNGFLKEMSGSYR